MARISVQIDTELHARAHAAATLSGKPLLHYAADALRRQVDADERKRDKRGKAEPVVIR